MSETSDTRKYDSWNRVMTTWYQRLRAPLGLAASPWKLPNFWGHRWCPKWPCNPQFGSARYREFFFSRLADPVTPAVFVKTVWIHSCKALDTWGDFKLPNCTKSRDDQFLHVLNWPVTRRQCWKPWGNPDSNSSRIERTNCHAFHFSCWLKHFAAVFVRNHKLTIVAVATVSEVKA